MTTNNDLIRQIPLFATLPPEEIDLLSRLLRPAKFVSGAILFLEGEPGDRFSIITEGEVEIVQSFGTSDERILSVERPGNFLGEVSLFDPDHRRSATARARSAVQLLEMTSAEFEALIHRQVPLSVALLRGISHRLRRSENLTIQDLQVKNRKLAQALHELQAAQEQLLEKERLEQELRLARSIQERTLPKELPVLPGWQITTYWQPARVVGGDFYDFIALPDGKLCMIIGDVTGKGMPAALIMATTRSLLHFAALNVPGGKPARPGEILARVNEMCCLEIPSNMFVTCLIAVVDPESGRTRFANAGHNLPYQHTMQGLIELRATGMPLGLMPNMVYEENEAVLAEGESLVMYSDGLTEAHNPHREMYGLERLQAHLSFEAGGQELIHSLLTNLAEFTGPGWQQEDDITCVILDRFLHK